MYANSRLHVYLASRPNTVLGINKYRLFTGVLCVTRVYDVCEHKLRRRPLVARATAPNPPPNPPTAKQPLLALDRGQPVSVTRTEYDGGRSSVVVARPSPSVRFGHRFRERAIVHRVCVTMRLVVKINCCKVPKYSGERLFKLEFRGETKTCITRVTGRGI